MVFPIIGREDSIQVTAPSDLVVDDAVARLVVEFAGRVPAGTVAAVVRRSRHDLDSSPPAALPELTERLARQRLRDRLLVAGAAAGG